MPSIDRSGGSSGQRPSSESLVLSSDWTGLSRHLIASFYPVRRVISGTTVRWERIPGSLEVQAPLTEAQAEITANWHSPFENQTADAKLSSLSSMLQVGGFEAILNSLSKLFGSDSFASSFLASANDRLQTLEGRTAVTKLNSTQVFSGMPPIKVNVTAHFRALLDPLAEVQRPMDQLTKWSLPRKLSEQGLVGNLVDTSQEKGWRTVYPSETPQIVAMQYAGMLFKPLVIEMMPVPITVPRDSAGRPLSSQATMSLSTLSAIDANDWDNFRR